jgi:hypothetical protein
LFFVPLKSRRARARAIKKRSGFLFLLTIYDDCGSESERDPLAPGLNIHYLLVTDCYFKRGLRAPIKTRDKTRATGCRSHRAALRDKLAVWKDAPVDAARDLSYSTWARDKPPTLFSPT